MAAPSPCPATGFSFAPREGRADRGRAAQRDAGIVTVGSGGRGAFKSALLGSVSRRLLQRANRPIVIVSPRAGASAGLDDD